ncbi:hypothetical protein SAMN05216577_11567 [Pseudomonas citronellolis]|uniref:Phage tail protein (Tail_P2_I) n=1 Tax=Pseudomonas citronellolis TaxID=53408 RepID=A0AAQ1KG42_9PSED|nr:hypothetical protein [Pseudomonas citronellolis]TGC32591.1 hypothetical protein CW310_01280 [Pseudomonas citronellolis]SFD04592.1 hypothetical protein SAMN05216577_11567 [Pseudomonas citronellolis]
MSLDAQSLYALLPAIHRVRDAEIAAAEGLARGPLEELLALLAEQLGVAEESLEQLYDDLFIETCSDWVVPYIGDLIGYQGLHRVVPKVASPRAEVAHTIALRRRKGTATVLEQLARDVTGWDARAVEYFQRLCASQYMNHPRPQAVQAPDLRQGEALEWLGTAFETANRSVDVRNIESARGRHNIPNVGLHLWRIQAYARSQAPCPRAGERRYRASPLGQDVALYNRPQVEDDIGHLAEPDNVPWPLSRRRLAAHLARHYGVRADATAPLDNPQPSLQLWVDGVAIERDHICICHLGDDAGGWAHTPPPDGLYSIDPTLGRIALPGDAADPAEVRLSWHEGACADLGGGEYERGADLPVLPEDRTPVRVPDDQPTLAAALAQIAGDGVVEITDNGRYEEALDIEVNAGGAVEIRAANGFRPLLALTALSVVGGADAACLLNGLLIAGAPLQVPAAAGNALARLELKHCTLVPGIALDAAGLPTQPATPSLELEVPGLRVELTRCILGAVRAHEHAEVTASDCLIDALARSAVAFAAVDGEAPGARLSLDACTLVGKLHTREVGLISNSILFAELAAADTWPAAVRALRKQVGCVRFSWLPLGSRVPRRHHCQPQAAGSGIAPRFTSLRYGTPAYGQLASSTPAEILQGADDESEMGVLHHLYGAQRLVNLRIRLAEYLRVGLRAGSFHES